MRRIILRITARLKLTVLPASDKNFFKDAAQTLRDFSAPRFQR